MTNYTKTMLIKLLIWVVIVTGLSWLVAGAEAQTIPTRLVIVKHPYATALEQTILVRQGLERLRETGVNPSITKISVVRDSLNRNKISQYQSRLDSWANLAYKKGWCADDQTCFLALPPVNDGKVNYQGGVAQDSCAPYWAAYAILRMRNDVGQARAAASRTAVAHEFGHLMGAEHDEEDRPYIMHPAALKYGEVRLPWSQFSKDLIDICLVEEGIRATSKYGFGNPNFKGRRLKRTIIEPLLR